MRKLVLVIGLALGCGGETTQVIEGSPCVATDLGTCVEVACPGSEAVEVCDGEDGAPGAPGPAGDDGAQGDTGPQGPPGDDGQDGAPGAVTSVTYLDFQPDDDVTAPPGGTEACVVDGFATVDPGEGVVLFTTFWNQAGLGQYSVYLRLSADGTTPGDPVSNIHIPTALGSPTWRQKFVDVQYVEGWQGDMYLHVCAATSSNQDSASISTVRSTVMTVTP